MTETKQVIYPDEMVLIPTYMVMIGCPKCKSRNIRTFPNVQFMEEGFPEEATNFIHIQGKCNDCDSMIMISPRQYMIDSHARDDKTGYEIGSCHFAGTLVDVGGEQTKKKRKRKKTKKKTPTLKAAPSAGLSDIDRETAESLGKAKPKKGRKKRKKGGEITKFDRDIPKLKDAEKKTPKAKRKKKPKTKKKAATKPARADSDEWYNCDYCDDDFAKDDDRLRHQKRCSKKPAEEEYTAGRPFDLPESTEVTQDRDIIDKSVFYSSSTDTLKRLVYEYRVRAYRKEFKRCPHTEYVKDGEGNTKNIPCDFKTKNSDEWLKPPMLKEISFGLGGNDDIMSPLNTPQEHLVLFFSECPQCGKLSILHQYITTLLWNDWIDHTMTMEHIISRGLMDGTVKKKEMTEEQIETRLGLEAERFGMDRDFMADVRDGVRRAAKKEIPEFEIPCTNPKCEIVWTHENSNPRWMTESHLVARCPVCGVQSPIQDLLGDKDEE